MSTYKLTPQQRKARAQALVAQRNAISRAKTNYTPTVAASQAQSAPKKDTNFLLRLTATNLDMSANILTGALKSLEGIVDLGAGLVGAVGGIFSNDFSEGVQDFIKYDAIGEWVGNPLDELLSDSYLEDSKAGQITEAVMQGVGQMLPAVIVTVATAGAGAPTAISQAAGLATTGVSAAGTSTEDAYKDGADYYQGLGYGVAAGGVEAATEKLTGGIPIFGKGMVDDVGKAIVKESAEGAVKAGAKVGAQRVVKNMVDEAAEEAIAEIANPALKSIYKGKDAFTEYGESDYWAGVGEAALVGGLTSAVYGGTLGKVKKLGGSSSIESDAREVASDIEYQTERMRKLEENGNLTAEKETQIKKVIKADVELLSRQLQKTSADKRAAVLKDPTFSSLFAEDGTVKAEATQRMDNAIKAASDTSHGLDRRYYSESARGREQEIIDGLAAQGTKVVSGELTAEESKAYTAVRKAHNKLRSLGFVDTDLVLAESMPNDNAYLDGKTVVLGRDALTNGTYIKTLVHETTHFTEGTNEWLDVTNYVFGKDGSSVTSLIDRVKNSGYGVTQDDVDAVLSAVREGKLSDTEFTEKQRTLISEVVAMQMEETFADERSVEHLVNDNPSLAKRIWERIKALVESFGKSKEERQELQNLRKTEELFRKALQNAGVEYIEGEIKKSAEDQADGEVKHLKKGNKDYFVEDKYFESQIQKWDSLQHGSYVKVGQINNGHPLVKVGMPQGIIKYDVDKLNKNMTKHAYLNEKLLKAIPDIIADPIAISEYTAENTVSVFGDIFVGSSPMMVGVTISKDRAGVNISKVRTYNARRDVGTLITNDSVLYLNEDKKRTRTWFQACGIQVPLGETRFGFIRSISQKDSNVNKQSKKSHPNIKEKNNGDFVYSFNAKKEGIPPTSGKPSFNNERVPIGDMPSKNSIPQTEEKSTLSDKKSSSKIRESRKLESENKVDRIDSDNKIRYDIKGVNRKPPELHAFTAQDEAVLRNKVMERNSGGKGLFPIDFAYTANHFVVYKNFGDGIYERIATYDIDIYKDIISQIEKEIKNGRVYRTQKDIRSDIVRFRFERRRNSSNSNADSNRGTDVTNGRLHRRESGSNNGNASGKSDSDKSSIKHSLKAAASTDIFDGTAARSTEYSSVKLAKLKANYHGEKVFNKSAVAAAINGIESVRIILPATARNNLINNVSIGYNTRLDSEHYAIYSEMLFYQIRSRIIRESEFELSQEELDKLDDEIVTALQQIVASGIDSVKTKLEQSVSENELKKQADYWRNEYQKATEQIKIRGRILSTAQKIKDLKKGAYVNASQYRSDIFKRTLEKLSRIQFRGNMSVSGTRGVFKDLGEWYNNSDNKLYSPAIADSGVAGRFDNEIKSMMSDIANGDGAFTTDELLKIEKVVSYFKGEIETYNTILRNGQRVEAQPIAESYIEKAKQAREIQLKYGVFRYITRNKYAVMVADPATLMRQADGYMNGFFTEMFEEMRQGEITSAVNEMELTREFQTFWKKNKPYRKRYNEVKIEINGKEVPLGYAISLYMTYQRKQAQAGLILSGFDILDGDKKVTVYRGTDEKLTQKQIDDLSKKRAAEIKAKLTEKDLELVAIMERAFEGCRKLKIDVDMALKHYTNVDKSGYYFPIRRSQIAQNVDMFSMFEGDRVSNLSMNKDTVKGAKNALLIEPAHLVFMRHVKATSLYSGLGIFTDNFNRLFNLNINGIPEQKPLSFEVPSDVKQSFGIKGFNDYIGVQKAVISTLSEERFFDNNVVVNKESGMEIEITKDGIRETLGPDMRFERLPKELKELKLQTLRLLPTLIEKATLTDNDVSNIHRENSKVKYAYLTKDITIQTGNKTVKYTISIAVRKSQQKNKFWVHEIRATKKDQSLISSGDINPQQEYNEALDPKCIISLDGEFVNTSAEKLNYNRPETIKSTLEADKFPKAMIDYFTEIKKDIEGISTKEQSTQFFNDAVRIIRSTYAKYQLGANPKVWATQFSSLFASTNILDYSSLARGFAVKGKADEVDKYCKLAWLRNVDDMAVKAQAVTDKIGKLGDFLMTPIGWVDRGVVVHLFGACQVQVAKDSKLALGTEENKKAAGELLQKVILETQQNSLASERSAAMRTNNDLLKSFTMFSADAMKVFSRFVDAFGEREVLRSLIKNEKDPKVKAEYEARLKQINKQCTKSISALVATSFFTSLMALLFKLWYRKDDEEDFGTFCADMFGNMIGGLPIVRDVYSFFADGYEVENFMASTFNDVLSASLNSFTLLGDAASGKDVSEQDIAKSIKNLVFASGQLTGIPWRNAYNFVTGNINRFFPATGYKIDSLFYSKAYSSDLSKAIENEDEAMIATIAGLMLNENVGGIESDAARTELNRLVTEGFDVIPRGVGDTITYDGETYELTSREKKEFSNIYNIANESLADMVKLARYKEATDEVKQKAIAFVYDVYYKLAIQDFLGEDLETKTVLFAEAIDIEKLALIVATARSLTADTDKDGKTVNGSRKKKVLAYINSLRLTAAEKYMVAGYLGYKNVKGEAQVKAHINTLNLTKSEKAKLLEYSGYAAS